MADRIVILDKGEIAQAGPPEEVYNRPRSAFVASFMGATNVMRLSTRVVDDTIEIEAGAHNRAVRLASRDAAPRGSVVAHFRGEAATLVAADDAASDALVLAGSIAQVSYPGGVWRYGVDVGERRFLVDSRTRHGVGERVGIRVPLDALHLFAADAATKTQSSAASIAA